jgi:hypothetical protein
MEMPSKILDTDSLQQQDTHNLKQMESFNVSGPILLTLSRWRLSNSYISITMRH